MQCLQGPTMFSGCDPGEKTTHRQCETSGIEGNISTQTSDTADTSGAPMHGVIRSYLHPLLPTHKFECGGIFAMLQHLRHGMVRGLIGGSALAGVGSQIRNVDHRGSVAVEYGNSGALLRGQVCLKQL
jgi:hypothetical protein